MPPKGAATTALKPMRLPPLHKLKVRRPNEGDANPCLSIMSSVLSTSPISVVNRRLSMGKRLMQTACWASAGYNVAGCQALETQLRVCMDTPVCGTSLGLWARRKMEGVIDPGIGYWIRCCFKESANGEEYRDRRTPRRTPSIIIYRGCTRIS